MPSPVEKELRNARKLQKQGKLTEAANIFARVLKQFPNNKTALESLQELESQIGQTTSASGKATPNDIQALIQLYNLGQYRELLASIDPLLRSYSKDLVLLNLQGAAFSAIGNDEAAITCYQSAIILAPEDAQSHNNLGNILAKLGDLEGAIKSYTQAIKLKPDYAEAFYNIGNAQNNQGHINKAIESYKQATKIKPDYFDAYASLAGALHSSGSLNESISIYDKAIELDPHRAPLFNRLGVVLTEKGDHERAIQSFRRSLALDSDSVQALANLGVVLTNRVFNRPDPELLTIILKLLDSRNLVDPSSIAPCALGLLKFDPLFISALGANGTNALDIPLKEITSLLCRVPVLLRLMEVTPLRDLALEEFLRKMRTALLIQNSVLDSSPDILGFQIALTMQCFTNEYLYEETETETGILEDLEQEIERKLNSEEQPGPSQILCFSSYRPLRDTNWAHLLALPYELKSVENRLILEPKRESALRSQIPVIGNITDTISSAVSSQYEEHPYPRWINVALAPVPRPAEVLLKKIDPDAWTLDSRQIQVPEILIAGCGTGEQPIQTASKFTECKVVAIDLSLSSLSYAKRKTEELGFDNIEYINLDILNLGNLNRKFDIIECAGVLHHMDRPLEGWTMLTKCLKPNGFMKIALYSRLARTQIAEIRKIIKQEHIGSSNSEMKNIRRQIINSRKYDGIKMYPDFYSMSMLRDLLFHEQEHQFDLRQIRDYLSKLGLVFCGFDEERIVREFQISSHYNNTIYDLDQWNAFEQKHPTTFAGMYQFWCRKSA